MPAGGAADPAALVAANRLVGNNAAAAGLEITLKGPSLRFPLGGIVALTGARFAATRSSGAALAWNETLVLAAGETLSLEQAAAGCRCWLAWRGGLAVPQVMGSRSTFLPAEFGGHQGRALRAGDRLASGTRAGGVRLLRAHTPHQASGTRFCAWWRGRRPASLTMPVWWRFLLETIGWVRRQTVAACG
ncbi:MAG: hypothetical protein Q8L71_09250 [Thiobacillus sp.]|nr:hypothetical protein [Thiobacillus sp.]